MFDNVAMIHEHSRAGRHSRRVDVLAAIDYVGLDAPDAKVGTLNARDRRLVELARALYEAAGRSDARCDRRSVMSTK